MTSKKTILIITFIIVVLLLIVLFATLNFMNNRAEVKIDDNQSKETQDKSVLDEKEEPQTAKNERQRLEDTKKMIREQIDEGMKSIPKNIAESYSSVNECKTISDPAEKDRCIILWAEYALDKSICDKLKSDLRQGCVDRTELLKATEEKNISSCKEIVNSGYRHGCIVSVIEALEGLNIDCKGLSTEDQEICQTYIETKDKKSAKECESIEDQEIKNICLDKFYANLDENFYAKPDQ